MLIEANIDALVGPTHHFGGLGVGNLASQNHVGAVSSPKRAAHEGLRKAALVANLGIPQFLFLPPVRPNMDLLSRCGFRGMRHEAIKSALVHSPHLLSSAMSSAFMWAANSATFSPAVDCADRRNHFTPANLISSWHRYPEARERESDLKNLFASTAGKFVIHPALPSIVPLRDEGAANHMRLSDQSGTLGFNIFVYGADDNLAGQDSSGEVDQQTFLPRQTLEASQAIARQHQLDPNDTFFLQQHPNAISAGVFHNDVIATSHLGLLLHHERAFLNADAELDRLHQRFAQRTGEQLQRIIVSEQQLPLADAVDSYFFNSQLLTPRKMDDESKTVLLCPQQCEVNEHAARLVSQLVEDPGVPIEEVSFVTLQESMANGGGPACLRLRVPIEEELMKQIQAPLRWTPELNAKLSQKIDELYPDSLSIDNFASDDFVNRLSQIPAELAKATWNRV